MVQTRSSSRKIHSESNGAQNVVDSSSEYVASTEPARKRQRRTQVDEGKPKKTRRNEKEKGKEKEKTSPQLNLDILFLIAAYLHPIDLLTLARTCRSIRDLLMDRSSAFVWRAARRQIKGLPDCPSDLSEPEYANLVFYARCHSCGKSAQSILWVVRRRYCPTCRPQRMRPLSSSWTLIRNRDILPAQWCDVKNVSSYRVDKEQLKAFRDKYEKSSDKTQLLNEMREHCRLILEHAKKCEVWQAQRDQERSKDMQVLRDRRRNDIFRCLEKHGYAAEVQYSRWYSRRRLQSAYIPVFNFRSSKPLTQKEWADMRPEWIDVMEGVRAERLERTVYSPRRRALEAAYDKYLAQPSTLADPNDIFPHAEDIAIFPPFDKIIKLPEGSTVNADSFASAFAELAPFVPEWRKKVDKAVASFIEIPPELSFDKAATKSGRNSKQKKAQATSSPTTKLQLACALFLRDFESHVVVVGPPELLSLNDCRKLGAEDSENRLPGYFEFCKTAPYVVHACGLDPHVTTVEDMENRNPRLICLDCDGPRIVRTWKNAICHAESKPHQGTPPHWQLVNDKHLSAIQAVEPTEETHKHGRWVRCLSCKPRANDAMWWSDCLTHIIQVHDVLRDEIKQGVHYRNLECGSSRVGMVEMVGEGDKVTFTAFTAQT